MIASYKLASLLILSLFILSACIPFVHLAEEIAEEIAEDIHEHHHPIHDVVTPHDETAVLTDEERALLAHDSKSE